MNNQLMRVVNANLSRFFKATALVLILSSAGYVASANPDPGTNATVIKHLGATNEALVFQVNVANEKGEKFSIVIKDNSGVILYRGVYNDKNFNKKFHLPKENSDKIVFVVKTAAGNKTESFEINSQSRTIEEVVVKRVS
jgi:hypothetical protein